MFEPFEPLHALAISRDCGHVILRESVTVALPPILIGSGRWLFRLFISNSGFLKIRQRFAIAFLAIERLAEVVVLFRNPVLVIKPLEYCERGLVNLCRLLIVLEVALAAGNSVLHPGRISLAVLRRITAGRGFELD